MAVSDESGEVPSLVTFRVIDGDEIRVEVAEGGARAGTIKSCVRQAGAKADGEAHLPAEKRFERFVSTTANALEAAGYKVDRIPEADFAVRLDLDLASGVMLAREEPLHPFGVEMGAVAETLRAGLQEIVRTRSDELAEAIRIDLASSEHVAAAQRATSGEAKQAMLLSRSKPLLEAMLQIDRAKLSDELCRQLLRAVVGLASSRRDHGLAAAHAEELLRQDPEMDQQTRIGLRNIAAIAAHERGETEYALSIWRELLRKPEAIDTGERGWIWRNMSQALERDSGEAAKAAEASVDAFLEAGMKAEAVKGLKLLARMREDAAPADAIGHYDKMLALMTSKGVLDDEIRANILHGKGRKLLDLQNPAGALAAAREAASLRRGIVGAEEYLTSSLHLAAIAAGQAGDTTAAMEYDAEAAALEQRTQSRHFEFARRIKALLEAYDPGEAAALEAETDDMNDPELVAGTGVAVTIGDPALSPQQRLGRLEALLAKLKKLGARVGTLHPVRLAIAQILAAEGEFQRAADWYKRILADHPLDVGTHMQLIQTLWAAGDWGSAAAQLKRQIERFGEQPNLLFAYGRSLFEAGDMSGSVTALSRALTLLPEVARLRDTARELRERALELGGTILPLAPPAVDAGPVTLAEVTAALGEFASFISSVKRMKFWQKPENGAKHAWVPRPEAFGQTLLHTYMQAKFGERVTGFEEIDAGAGRLDLLLQFTGGLSVIIELKMCGSPYTTTYAKEGEGQILHYMANRRVRVGFLVVFDGRLRDGGKVLLDGPGGSDTVTEILIDISPTVQGRPGCPAARSRPAATKRRAPPILTSRNPPKPSR